MSEIHKTDPCFPFAVSAKWRLDKQRTLGYYSLMRPEIRHLHSPDVEDLKRFVPDDEGHFGFLLQLIVGPEGEEGEESFDIQVCTPGWISRTISETGPLVGRHHLIVSQFDYSQLERFLYDYCRNCDATTWKAVAEKLARLGKWEFEDYKDGGE